MGDTVRGRMGNVKRAGFFAGSKKEKEEVLKSGSQEARKGKKEFGRREGGKGGGVRVSSLLLSWLLGFQI
jgi:hypothetical protein